MKNQIKKSLSFLMAVLMLMSCWVWVAPEKAEAAGSVYTMNVKWLIVNNIESSKAAAQVIYKYRPNYGTGAESDWQTVDVTSQTKGSNGSTASVAINIPDNGFPTEVKMAVQGVAWPTDNGDVVEITFNYVDVNQVQIWGENSAISGSSGNKYSAKDQSHRNDWTETTVARMGDGLAGSVNWKFPAVSKISSDGEIEITSDKLGGLNKTGSTTFSATDQYGVTGSINPFNLTGVRLEHRGSSTVTVNNASATFSGNKATVTIPPNNQITAIENYGANNGKVTYYLVASYNSITAEAKVTVNFPTYSATFDANGGIIGDDESSAKDTITLTNDKMWYGSVIGNAPAYASKAGKQFVGFYSQQNSDGTGLTNSFNGTKFENGVTKVSNTGDSTWYAAWESSSITATFLTADGQLIGTLEGRYDNNYAATNMYNGVSGINTALKNAYKGNTVKFDSNNAPIYKNGSTEYDFSHWKIIEAYNDSVIGGNEDTNLQGDVTFQAVYRVKNSETYTVTFYDGNGGVLDSKGPYHFRDNVTVPNAEPTKATDDRYEYEFIGWANNIGKAFYAVDNEDKNEDGAAISYYSKDVSEFTVRGNASYVPVFRMTPRKYKVTFNYTGDKNTPQSVTVDNYTWHAGIVMPESIKDNYTANGYRYHIDGWTVGGDTEVKKLDSITVTGDMTLNAHYGKGEAAKYTINFYDKDGKLLNEGNNIYEHNTTVTVPTVDQTIDTDTSLFTFAGWSPEVNATATGDAEYHATYTKKDYANISFYNHDGKEIYSLNGKDSSIFVGDTIPAFDTATYGEPTKESDMTGDYSFYAWSDSLNGNNTIKPGEDKVTGDMKLYAIFAVNYKNYTVKFVNEDATVSEKTYHYGDEIKVPSEEPTKAPDETYTYDFKAWEPDVSEICLGDATYTAAYRKTYNYYKVTWLKDDKTVLTETNYTYQEKIQQAFFDAPVGYAPADEGYTWVLKSWIQCNKDGKPIDANGQEVDEANAVKFVRGMKMGTTPLYFYPVFEQEANVLTVKFYKENGTTYIGETKVPYNEALDSYAAAFESSAYKSADEAYHYNITGWTTLDGKNVTNVTDNISVKPVYNAEAHNKQIYEIVKYPTCTEVGYVNMKCDSDACNLIDYNVKVDPIPDESKPTGQIYVGDTRWSDKQYTAGINYDEVIYVGPSTNTIVNAEDTGTRSAPWNLLAEYSRGVGLIDYFVTDEIVTDPATIGDWVNVYNYDSVKQGVLEQSLISRGLTMADYEAFAENNAKKLEIDKEVEAVIAGYNANATGILDELGLENDKEYIIYVRVSDRMVNGDSNVLYFSSGKFHYGSTPATITVSGDGYGTKFCEKATVEVTDDHDGFTVLLDGKAVTLTDGKLEVTAAGVHNVSVTDKNGNKTTKSFEIKGNHTFRNYTVSATCEADGSRYDLCTVCGVKANVETLTALGHNYSTNYTEKAATCVVDGYRTYTCSNGCGGTLVLKPTDSAETLAQAKKYVAGEGTQEGTWESVTAEDLAHLKASGVHTYAKVKDSNGDDTTEDAWVIDKAATCSATGEKHKDCTVCGARVTEVIATDADAHKFYRAKVKKGDEPTCTNEGKKVKQCRYCGIEVVDEILPELGHTEGEYSVITEATCEAVGSKILTCSVCGTDIGEAVTDADGKVTFNGEPVEIPALGHAWKADGEPYEKDVNGTIKWYQNYKCNNGCGKTEERELADGIKQEATVTFKAEDTADQTVNTFIGETISALEVTEPTKAANETYKYSFAYWATRTGAGTTEDPFVYTEAQFPIEVTAESAEYYAVFAEKYINYTITYYKEDGLTQYKKVGYLHNGDTVTLLKDGPAKAGNAIYEYVFAGWKLGDVTYGADNNTYTIAAADVNFIATYKEVKKQYAVTYANTKSDIFETFMVEAGTSARDCYTVPVKAPTSSGHYFFMNWNKAEQLKSVESNIYTTPNFIIESHKFVKDEANSVPATCTSDAVIGWKCSDCGYSFTAVEPNSALGHNFGTPIYDAETGKYNETCQNENCGLTQEFASKFTAKFFVNASDEAAIKTINYITWGSKLTSLPANPSKDSTTEYDYAFAGWFVKGDASETLVDFNSYEVKANVDFVAKFTSTARKYTVIFAYDANNVIEAHKDVPAGSSVSFGGATPVKASDRNGHYTFSKWSALEAGVNTVENIQGDVYLTAVFTKGEHTFDSGVTVDEATCQHGKGIKYTCTFDACGYNYTVEMGKPLAHDYEVIDKKDATPTKDGYIKYQCKNIVDGKRCTAAYEETLKYVDDSITIKVTVTHNGAPKSGVQVEIQSKLGGEPVFVTTNANGVATAVGSVDAPGYSCWVIIDGERKEITLTNAGNGNLEGSYDYTDRADCTCACHRDNLWGVIFRFFHKIIKLFTGEFKCCKNPDPMYG